ncbi:OLC1v1020497C1 [Oldenlandia corymbosa var. corymbosa]|uniref:OLC1v1020497C1 n=1 Tax=Oldenlandia corymbosa var. corymbosa TaxID=529605 RepID=A0AAV1EGV8_OLDCO|nr:OLC1v1020497C1 [Oldenlandia corymbosa var. corymbosa]
MEAKMDVISKELIKPSSPTPQDSKTLELSLLDQIIPHFFVRFLFVYEKQRQPSVDPSKTTAQLKKSLSETLTKFYPLAGKLSPDHHSVDCDDSGVLFVEANVDATLSQAVQNAPFERFSQYMPSETYIRGGNDDSKAVPFDANCGKGDILFAVQITWFRCGGASIGACISHKVADFMSLIAFMNSWAAMNRGENTSKSDLLMKVPVFDYGTRIFPPLHNAVRAERPKHTNNEGKMVCKRFVFNKEKITELKQILISSSSSSSTLPIVPEDLTRVKVVSAFLWKQFINVAVAKNNQAGGANVSLFKASHTVNLRSRIGNLQTLSSNEFAFGNIMVPVFISFTLNQNLQTDFYGDLFRLMGDALSKVNEDYVVNRAVPLFKIIATRGLERVSQQPTWNMAIHETRFSSYCRFPICETDFGWGKPVSVGPVDISNSSMIILISTKDEEGIEAWVTMSEDEVALFSDDLLSIAAPGFFSSDFK